jgi:hypothetical protein
MPQVVHASSGKQVPEIWTWKDIVITVAHCDNSADHTVMLPGSEILSGLLCSKLLRSLLCCIYVEWKLISTYVVSVYNEDEE